MVRGRLEEIQVIDPSVITDSYYLTFPYIQTVDELFLNPLSWEGGEQFEVLESCLLSLGVENPLLVDVDLTWFGGKYYFGTWRLNCDADGSVTTDGDEGFITNRTFVIQRRSCYNLGLAGSNPRIKVGNSSIGNCDFRLLGNTVRIGPPNANVSATTLAPASAVNLFKTTDYRDTVRLETGKIFDPRIRAIGIKLKPGVFLALVEYERTVINRVVTSRPSDNGTIVCPTNGGLDG